MRRGNTWKPRSARWLGFGRLLTPLTAVGIMMIALCLAGCASSRKASAGTLAATAASREDSVMSEVRTTLTEAVPTERTRLAIPVAAVTSLPEGAGYHVRSGRVSATAERAGDTLVVYATCDSLLRLCEQYERSAARYKAALEAQQEEERTASERRSNPIRRTIIALIAGAAAGIVVTIKTKRLWQRQC